MSKTALIFGATGQDGFYLSELLQSKGYEVRGTCLKKPDAVLAFACRACDVADASQVAALVSEIMPDEAYNLAGLSSPRLNETNPTLSYAVNAVGAKNILSALEKHAPACKFFQASTGYIFLPGKEPKNECSPFGPTGVYGKTKLEAHLAAVAAREGGLFAANGILFNHESPRRPPEFVVRKITRAAAEFKLGKRVKPLELGNTGAVRDWGYAGDYVKAMWLMLQAKKPKDYVIATGKGRSVQELCKEAFSAVGLDYSTHIATDQGLLRKNEIDVLVGDPTAIKTDLKWSADTTFGKLIGMMVEADLKGA